MKEAWIVRFEDADLCRLLLPFPWQPLYAVAFESKMDRSACALASTS